MKYMILLFVFLVSVAAQGQASSSPDSDAIELYKQGKAALERGGLQEAAGYFEASLKICTGLNNQQCRAVNLSELGGLYAELGRRSDSLSAFQEALRIRSQSGASPEIILRSLNDVGEALYAFGKFNEAVSTFEEANSMAKSLGIKEASAAILNSMGMAYTALNRLDKALVVFNESLALRKELGLPKEIIVQNLNNIGTVYLSGKQYQQALPYLEEAVGVLRGSNNPEAVATCLNNLGYAHASLNHHEQALACYEEALRLRKNLNTPLDRAIVLNNMGLLFTSMGRDDDALIHHEAALKIRTEAADQKGIAESLSNTGTAANAAGDYDKALGYFNKALKIQQTLKDSRAVSTSLNNLASVYDTVGQYDKALQYHEQALRLRKEVNIPADTAVTLNNIGLVQINLGLYDKALASFEESLALKKQHHLSPETIAVALNNIGVVYDSIGQREKALGFHREALTIRKGQNLSREIGNSLSNIGAAYLTLKKYPEAESAFIEAAQALNRADKKVKGNPGLVNVYLATGRYDGALNLLKVMAPDWVTDDANRMQYHTLKGLALKGLGRLKEATGELVTAVSISEATRQRTTERSGFFASGFSGGRIRSYRALLSVLAERALQGDLVDTRLARLGKDTADAAFHIAESIKARTLLESMSEARKSVRKRQIPEEWRVKEQSLLRRITALDKRWEKDYTAGEAAMKAHNRKKEQLAADFRKLIGIFRQKFPRYAALYYPDPISAATLPLRNDETLLEYAFGDDACYLFIVKKGGGKKVLRISSSPETLEKAIKTFLEPLNNNQPERFSDRFARELGDTLMAGNQQGIREGSKVVIIPDGMLGLVPFGVLMPGAGSEGKPTYLAERWVITYSQSASALALDRLLRPAKTRKPLFSIGNPIFDKNDPRYIAFKQGKPPLTLAVGEAKRYAFRGLAVHSKVDVRKDDQRTWDQVVFSPLPETEIEVRAIAKILGVKPVPPDILLGINASKSTMMKARLEEYRYLHFATHADLPGNVQGVNEPFILLGQVENDAQEDGFLTLSEIMELELNADMVMLSACNTGKGDIVAGEGVANLARAFQHAGARSVVTSLWEVASDPAVEYMKLFYGHLKTTENRAVALHLAQKEIRKKYPSPFVWGVFAFYGDGGR